MSVLPEPVLNSTLSNETGENYYYDTDYNETLRDHTLEHISNVMLLYYMPSLIILGCAGNVISIAVFCKSKLRLQSTSQYLTVLALVDTITLILLLHPWLSVVDDNLYSFYGEVCQCYVYLAGICNFLSAWLIVAFTAERFIAVVYPFRLKSLCTVKHARILVLILTLVSFTINLPVIFLTCTSHEVTETAYWFHMFLTVITYSPALIAIVVLNSCIIVSVYKSSRTHKHASKERVNRRVTTMLLTVSSVYVFLTLPVHIMQYRIMYVSLDSSLIAIEQILRSLHFLNFGINFYLYCLTGSNFRSGVREIFSCQRRRDVIIML